MDPHHRIKVILGQLRHDIMAGNGDEEVKLRCLMKYKAKALDLLIFCNDIDPLEIENAFPREKELEAML